MTCVVSNYLGGTPRKLARLLGCRVVRPDRMKKADGLVVNFGTTRPLLLTRRAILLNPPLSVNAASNKLISFNCFLEAGVPSVSFTEDKKEAYKWLLDGSSVVCRKLIRGHSGKGIEIVKRLDWKEKGKPKNILPDAPLYTRYFKKVKEVRVHVFGDEVIAYAEKRRVRGEEADTWVRSHDRGWIFAQEGVVQDDRAIEAALAAVSCLNLDFGAVDICIGEDRVAVLEVNSAPGLEGRTLKAYAIKFEEIENAAR